MRKIFLAVVLVLGGCISSPKYIEGTSLQLGAYIPSNGNLYGIELMSYVSGCIVRGTATNQAIKIDRTYCATNSYFWGAVETRESTRTTVDCK